jgi:hypothetical protein
MNRAIDNTNPKFKVRSFIQEQPPISHIFKDIPTTSHLTEIKIDTLNIDDDNDGFNLDWDNLSQILVQPQFSALQRVSVMITESRYSMFSYDRMYNILRQMSDLHGRGILNIIEKT